MKAISHVEGRVAVLDRPDVDTDQIIPKQFLKRIERTGYGQYAFFDWRFDDEGNERPGFELNQPQFAGAQDPARGPQLRLRLVARARRLGAAGLRASTSSSRRRSATSSARTRPRPASCSSSCPRSR